MAYKILTSYELTNDNTYYVTVMVIESDADLPRSVLPCTTLDSVPELHLGPFYTPEEAKAKVKPVIDSAKELITELRSRVIPEPEMTII